MALQQYKVGEERGEGCGGGDALVALLQWQQSPATPAGYIFRHDHVVWETGCDDGLPAFKLLKCSSMTQPTLLGTFTSKKLPSCVRLVHTATLQDDMHWVLAAI